MEAGDLWKLFKGDVENFTYVQPRRRLGEMEKRMQREMRERALWMMKESLLGEIEDYLAEYRSFDVTQTGTEIVFYDPAADRHLFGDISGTQLRFDQHTLSDDESGAMGISCVNGIVIDASRLALVETMDIESSDRFDAYHVTCFSEIAR